MVKDWRGQDEGKREGELWSSHERHHLIPFSAAGEMSALGTRELGHSLQLPESNSANKPWETPISSAWVLAAAWLSPRVPELPVSRLLLLHSSPSIWEAVSQLLMHTPQTHVQLPGRELHNGERTVPFFLRPGIEAIPSFPCPFPPPLPRGKLLPTSKHSLTTESWLSRNNESLLGYMWPFHVAVT